MTEPNTARILLVDDEPAIAHSLRRALRQEFGGSLVVDTCHSGEDAIELLLARRFDAVISDLHMPGMSGMAFLERAAQIQPECVRMILSGSTEFTTVQRSVNTLGVFRYLTKPWSDDDVATHVREALRHGATLRVQRDQAEAWAASRGQISVQELERRRLEQMEPGITQVEWALDGSVIMPPLDSA